MPRIILTESLAESGGKGKGEERMEAHLEKLQGALAESISGMSEEELNWHPAEKWSAVEVMEHLYLTYTGTMKGFERAVQKGHPVVTPATWGQHWRRWVVTSLGYLPAGRKAPAFAQPRGLARETVMAEFAKKIAEMDEIIAGCEARFGRKVKLLDHAILGPLTGAEWRKFHLVHGLHHVKQIRALRAAAGTPGKRSS
jgi:DinB superfamily